MVITGVWQGGAETPLPVQLPNSAPNIQASGALPASPRLALARGSWWEEQQPMSGAMRRH